MPIKKTKTKTIGGIIMDKIVKDILRMFFEGLYNMMYINKKEYFQLKAFLDGIT